MTKTSPHARTVAAAETRLPVGVHLVGSVPLDSAEDVFRRAAHALGDRLRRMPDGETGPRSDWILWQYPVFSSRPQFEVGPPGAGTYRALPQLRLRPARPRCSLTTSATRRPRSTRTRRSPGSSATGTCPPTAASRFRFRRPWRRSAPSWPRSTRRELEPVYEARMFAELERLLAAIPHDQLAIQWDTRFEFAMLEGVAPRGSTSPRGGSWSGCCASRARCPRTSSSASISVTATRRTATSSPRRRRSSSRSPTRCRRASSGR